MTEPDDDEALDGRGLLVPIGVNPTLAKRRLHCLYCWREGKAVRATYYVWLTHFARIRLATGHQQLRRIPTCWEHWREARRQPDPDKTWTTSLLDPSIRPLFDDDEGA